MLGNSLASRCRQARLCSCPERNHPEFVRPPVREQQRPEGIAVLLQEAVQVRCGVPGPCRDVDDGCARVLIEQLAVHRRHPRHDVARALGAHEGVPGGDEGAGQRGADDRVVDVADDAERLVATDDLHGCLNVLGVGRADPHVVPARRQTVVLHRHVDVAAAVAAGPDRPAAHGDRDRDVHRRRRDERPPSALLVLRGAQLAHGCLRVGAGVALGLAGEQHPAEHPHEPLRPVAGVADDAGAPPPAAQHRVDLPVPRVLDDRCSVGSRHGQNPTAWPAPP